MLNWHGVVHFRIFLVVSFMCWLACFPDTAYMNHLAVRDSELATTRNTPQPAPQQLIICLSGLFVVDLMSGLAFERRWLHNYREQSAAGIVGCGSRSGTFSRTISTCRHTRSLAALEAHLQLLRRIATGLGQMSPMSCRTTSI
jgi:hypothetical protein